MSQPPFMPTVTPTSDRRTCPACLRTERNALFTCTVCWPKIPAKDRQQLNAMRLSKQDTTSKLDSVVRGLHENGVTHVDPVFR